MPDRTVSVALKAKVDGYVTGMKKAHAVTQDMNTAAKKASTQTEVLGKVATAVGAYAAWSFGKRIVTAASDMNEMISKSHVVFGESAKAVREWSETSVDSMLMSQKAAISAAATYGNLFVSMGMGQEPAAKMSMSLVQLAADLSSFNDVPIDDALDAIRAGLIGEVEPMRRFGVMMDDATLRQKALAMGLVTTTKDVLPPAIRLQAAYAVIMDKTKTAQGDAVRTGDQFANSMRKLQGATDDAMAALGQDLLPVATKGVQAFTDLLTTVSNLPGPVRDVALALVAVGAAALLAGPPLVRFNASLVQTGTTATAFAGKVGRAGLAVGAFIAVLEAGSAAGNWLEDWSGYVSKEGKEASATLLQIARSGEITTESLHALGVAGNADVGDMLHAVFSRNAAENFSAFWGKLSTANMHKDYVDEWRKFAASTDAGLAYLAGQGPKASAAAKQVWGQIVAEGAKAGVSVEQLRKEFPQYAAAAEAAAVATDKYGKTIPPTVSAEGALIDANGKVIRSAKDMASGWYDAEGALVSLADRMAAINDPAHALIQAQMDSIDASRTLTQSIKENGTSLDINKEKGEANRRAVLGRIDTIMAEAAAMEASGIPADKVITWLETQKQGLITTLTKLGVLPSKARAVVAELFKIPPPPPIPLKFTYPTGAFRVSASGALIWARTGHEIAEAAGGYISGPGSGTSDSIPAWLSNGEYVMSARAVKTAGRPLLDALNAGRTLAAAPTATPGTYASLPSAVRNASGVSIHELHVSVPPSIRPADAALIREQVEVAVGAAIETVSDTIAWRNKR